MSDANERSIEKCVKSINNNTRMSLQFLFVLLWAAAVFGANNSIHTVGQATCNKAGSEQRITMRRFGDKQVPCDVIFKQSEEKFKKLHVVADSKKDPSLCIEQFVKIQTTLKSKGYTCAIALDPSGASKKKDIAPVVKSTPKIDIIKEPPVSAKSQVAPIAKVKPVVTSPPVVNVKPKAGIQRNEATPPPPPPPESSSPQKQTPPPPPPN